jgi:hypothetical protein
LSGSDHGIIESDILKVLTTPRLDIVKLEQAIVEFHKNRQEAIEFRQTCRMRTMRN